jgi:hypothetical protein
MNDGAARIAKPPERTTKTVECFRIVGYPEHLLEGEPR